MAETVFQKFKLAIKAPSTGNQAIEATYLTKVRKLWPLVLGENDQGKQVVLCYQYSVGGVQSPEPDPLKNLRCFKILGFGDVATVNRIPYDGPPGPPVLKFKPIKKQTCVDDVQHYRQPPDP